MTARFTPLRFISASGPDLDPVEFRGSAPDITAARVAKINIDKTLNEDFTTVIYRLFYDSVGDKFFSSRQFHLDAEDPGEELYAGEPPGRALAYELFSTPKSLLSPSPNQAEPLLQQQVMAIFTHSNTHRPGGVQP